MSEPGQNTVLDRLLDILLVLAIRTSLRQSTTTPRWYKPSADPRLQAALEAMHGDAAHPWSVPELAKLSGMSRAAFARAFGEVLGQPPMQYLTDWRMTLLLGDLNFAPATPGSRKVADCSSSTTARPCSPRCAAFSHTTEVRRSPGEP